MKTKEFIKKVKELGFDCYEDSENIAISEKDKGYTISLIYKNQMYSLSSGDDLYVEHPEKYITKELFDLIYEYIKTPIEEREDPKKYYLRHKWMQADDYNYLSVDLDDNAYCLNDIDGFDWTKNKFTREEIDEIKEKYNTSLEDFDIVEVKN